MPFWFILDCAIQERSRAPCLRALPPPVLLYINKRTSPHPIALKSPPYTPSVPHHRSPRTRPQIICSIRPTSSSPTAVVSSIHRFKNKQEDIKSSLLHHHHPAHPWIAYLHPNPSSPLNKPPLPTTTVPQPPSHPIPSHPHLPSRKKPPPRRNRLLDAGLALVSRLVQLTLSEGFVRLQFPKSLPPSNLASSISRKNRERKSGLLRAVAVVVAVLDSRPCPKAMSLQE